MGDSLSFGIVTEEVVHFVIEVGKVAVDLDDILILAFCYEEVRMWFYPFCFMDDGDGGAVEEVFAASAISMTW